MNSKPPFNLNVFKKPETKLNANLINEMINIYGVQMLWVRSERVNEDFVFKDFSHYKVGDQEFEQVMMLPEDTTNWDGDRSFGNFGFYQNYSVHLFISTRDLESLYPDFFENKNTRNKIINSLIITPGSTVLEITDMTNYSEGISNLYTYSDEPEVYKLTCKVYTSNISDEGVSTLQSKVEIQEGPIGSRTTDNQNSRIFDHTEEVYTTDVEDFFSHLDTIKDKQNEEGDKISDSGGVFGDLG